MQSTFRVIDRHLDAFCLAFTLGATSVALRPNATLIPLIITLTGILFYSPFVFRKRQGFNWPPVALYAVLSLGTAISKIHASLSALSDLGVSLLTLIIASMITSGIVIFTSFFNVHVARQASAPWAQLTLFPVLWASVWSIVANFNPVGYLFTWNVSDNNDVYTWLTPILGPASKDWLVASCAVLASEMIGSWYVEPPKLDIQEFLPTTDPPVDAPEDPTSLIKKTQLYFAALLSILIVPSLIIDPLPLATAKVSESTAISVACILPVADRYNPRAFTLEDYIKESERFRSGSRVLLWPEGAISFDNATHRDEGFANITERLPGTYIGVSFEERMAPTWGGQRTQKKTGMALISFHSSEPHFIYYKRNLVPVAESFSLLSSTNPPPLFEAELPVPPGVHKIDWSSNENHTRPFPMTASICLDFAFPVPFSPLKSKPALILAPAHTWDRVVGRAMWHQAKQRAAEVDSHLLWCDGGDGGMSGVIGPGISEIQQVGQGSFARTIGVPYPFKTGRTWFASIGTFWVLVFFWVVALGPWIFGRRSADVNVKWHALRASATEILKARLKRGRPLGLQGDDSQLYTTPMMGADMD